MTSNKINTKFLYTFYPYTRIVEGDVDEINKKRHIALIYNNTIVGLGEKSISISNSQNIYIDIIRHKHVAMKKRIHDLCLGDDAAMSLWVQIKDLKVAKREELPEPEPELIYQIYGITDGVKTEYRVFKYPWFNRHKNYKLGCVTELNPEFTEICRSDDISELANILSEKVGRKIALL